ncbi:MAG: aldehyde dehydrogenase family protein [Paracoccaceae bacterium]
MQDLNIRVAQGVDTPAVPYQARHFINGVFLDSEDGQTSNRISPSHGTVASQAALGSGIETRAAIKAARVAFDDRRWRGLSGKARAVVLNNVADLIEQNQERLALIETLETGKPISQSRNECGGAADLWRYAAMLARTAHGDSHNALGDDILGVVVKEPIGVVSIITPWNFPFWILSQKLPFALAAGCTCVVKPSEFTPSTTAMLCDLLMQAGLPAGVCNIVLGYGDPVGSLMSTHEDIDMVSFTGSTAVGKTITKSSGDTLKKVALELGGKNPQVIFPDADLASASDAVVFGVYFNAGQCCNSSSRILVHEDIADDFVSKVVALSRKVVFGNPIHPDTQVGAIVTEEHKTKIDNFVKAAMIEGAEVCLGGDVLNIEGLSDQFYQPTILRGVTSDMAIAREEVFGPVLTVQTFKTFDQAIALANDTIYGLSAGVWSESTHICLDFCRRVEAGTVWTNTWMDGYPELSFGGMKQSGQGREIGRYGFEEFLEVKSMVMRIGRTRTPWVNTA